MSDKVDPKTINNDLSVEETLKVQEELRKAVRQTEKSIMPYSTEYMVRELKQCLKPLLKKKDVAKKWSHAILDFSSISASELSEMDMYIEQNLLANVTKKSYINAFNNIQKLINQLIGQIILRKDLDYIEIDELMIQIRKKLNYIYELGRSVNSWLYDEADFYNSYDYQKLFDIKINTKFAFDKLYKNFSNIEIEKISFKKFNAHTLKEIEKINSYYEKVLTLGRDILEKNDDNKLYKYKNIIKNLLNKIYYLAGQIYMNIEPCSNVLSKIENEIDKNFKVLTNDMFGKLLYCDLKEIIHA